MNINGTPDLLTSGQLARRNASVNADLARVLKELATGERTDVVAASGGDPARLYALERDLSANETRKTVIDLAVGRATVAQGALGRLQDASQSLGVSLASFVALGDLPKAELKASEARGAFEDAVSAMNSRFADRSLFAGAAANLPALAPAEDILADIAALVAPAATAADVIVAVDTYFGDPAGFATTGYLGPTIDAPDAVVAEGESVDFAVRADRQEVKDVLAGLALAVVGAESGFAGASSDERLQLLGVSADRLLPASEGVIRMRAELGVAEQRLEQASVQNEAARLFLNEARNRILARDQFEAATEFTALETQLQSMLAVTARLSNLNLTNFLR